MGKDLTGLIILLLALAGASAVYLNAPPAAPWSDAERQAIQSLSLAALPPLPSDPSNAVANHPVAQGFRPPPVLRCAAERQRRGLLRHLPPADPALH